MVRNGPTKRRQGDTSARLGLAACILAPPLLMAAGVAFFGFLPPQGAAQPPAAEQVQAPQSIVAKTVAAKTVAAKPVSLAGRPDVDSDFRARRRRDPSGHHRKTSGAAGGRHPECCRRRGCGCGRDGPRAVLRPRPRGRGPHQESQRATGDGRSRGHDADCRACQNLAPTAGRQARICHLACQRQDRSA